MTAVMRLHPDGEEVYGLLRDCDTDRVARFERVKPGWYREVCGWPGFRLAGRPKSVSPRPRQVWSNQDE